MNAFFINAYGASIVEMHEKYLSVSALQNVVEIFRGALFHKRKI